MSTVTIDVNDLPARYAEAVSRAEHGEEVLITAAGLPPARFIPVPHPPRTPRILGLHRGAAVVPPDFNDPLPDEFWSDEAK